MNIEFISVCYNFQRRMMCFLSSLLQQTYLPNITINLAYIRNNGSPVTESLIDFYRKRGIKFRAIAFDDVTDIAYRAKLRNAQIALSRSEWLFFYDVDQILPPDFFEKWSKVLNDEKCIFSEEKKYFTDPAATQEFIDKLGGRRYLHRAFLKVDALPKINVNHCNVASGGLMIIKRKHLYEVTDGKWGDASILKDRHFYKQRTLSDPVFRKHFKVQMSVVAPVVHLGHCSWGDYKAGKIIQQ